MRTAIALFLLFIFCSNPQQSSTTPTHVEVKYSEQSGLQFTTSDILKTGGLSIGGEYISIWPEGNIQNNTGDDVKNLKISFALFENSKYRETIDVNIKNIKNNSYTLNDGDIGNFACGSDYIFVSDPESVTVEVFLDYTGYLK